MDNQKNPTPIESFVNQYKADWGEYARIAEEVRQRLVLLLEANGIMAIVSARAKTAKRLRDKLYRLENEMGRPFSGQEEIANRLHDLVGARIALYFPADSKKIRKLLHSDFSVVREPKVFPPKVPGYEDLVAENCTAYKRKIYPGYENRRFDGYCATHHYIQLRTPLSEQIPNPVMEVQVASVLMHAWSEVEHDLAYKKMTGAVSREEYECLDEINGLVIAGEIALNRLHVLSKQRVRMLSRIDSAVSLMLYLTDWLEQRFGSLDEDADDQDMTNVKQLFEMYREAELLTPGNLELRLRRLGGDLTPSLSALVKRLIDQFSDENRKKAKQVTVENLLQYLGDEEAFYTGAKLGAYLGKWNALEDLVRRAVRSLGYKCSNNDMSWKWVVEQRVLSHEVAERYRYLRNYRNRMVHANQLPEEAAFKQLLKDMDSLAEKLKQEYNVK